MANLRYATARRNAMMDHVRTALAGGSIKVEAAPSPPTLTRRDRQTLLATLTLASPAGAASSGGTFTFGTITSGTAVATGTASWARMLQSDGTTVVGDMDVGTSGATFILDTVSIVSGGTVAATGDQYAQHPGDVGASENGRTNTSAGINGLRFTSQDDEGLRSDRLPGSGLPRQFRGGVGYFNELQEKNPTVLGPRVVSVTRSSVDRNGRRKHLRTG
jgi:hypothetical protein